jgi:hypothetical protein
MKYFTHMFAFLPNYLAFNSQVGLYEDLLLISSLALGCPVVIYFLFSATKWQDIITYALKLSSRIFVPLYEFGQPFFKLISSSLRNIVQNDKKICLVRTETFMRQDSHRHEDNNGHF